MSMSARPDGEIGPRAMVIPDRRPAGNLPGRPGQVRGIAGPGPRGLNNKRAGFRPALLLLLVYLALKKQV